MPKTPSTIISLALASSIFNGAMAEPIDTDLLNKQYELAFLMDQLAFACTSPQRTEKTEKHCISGSQAVAHTFAKAIESRYLAENSQGTVPEDLRAALDSCPQPEAYQEQSIRDAFINVTANMELCLSGTKKAHEDGIIPDEIWNAVTWEFLEEQRCHMLDLGTKLQYTNQRCNSL